MENVLCPFISSEYNRDCDFAAVHFRSVKMCLLSNLDDSRHPTTHICLYSSILKVLRLFVFATLKDYISFTNAAFSTLENKAGTSICLFFSHKQQKKTIKLVFWLKKKKRKRIKENSTQGQWCSVIFQDWDLTTTSKVSTASRKRMTHGGILLEPCILCQLIFAAHSREFFRLWEGCVNSHWVILRCKSATFMLQI